MNTPESRQEGNPEFVVQPNMEGNGYNVWREGTNESAPFAGVFVIDQTTHQPPTTTFRTPGIGVFNGPPGHEKYSVQPAGEKAEVTVKTRLVQDEAMRTQVAEGVARLAFMLAGI